MTGTDATNEPVPVCFFNASRTCPACIAYIPEVKQCQVLGFAATYCKNQEVQAEVLQGIKSMQNDAIPAIKAFMPMVTKLAALGEKAMPVMEKLVDKTLKELEEELDDG